MYCYGFSINIKAFLKLNLNLKNFCCKYFCDLLWINAFVKQINVIICSIICFAILCMIMDFFNTLFLQYFFLAIIWNIIYFAILWILMLYSIYNILCIAILLLINNKYIYNNIIIYTLKQWPSCRALYNSDQLHEHERTYRVAAIDLINGQFRLRKPGVASAVPQFDEQPFVSRTAEVTLTEVTAICGGGQLLILFTT